MGKNGASEIILIFFAIKNERLHFFYIIHITLIFRDFFTNMAERLKLTGKSNPQRAFLMTPSISQKVDQQMIDEVNEFQELMFQMSPSTQGPR